MFHSETVLTTTQLVLSGLFIGVVTAAPTGPVNIICIQRTLERGFWGGLAAGLGAVMADGLIATAAAFGVTAIKGIMANYAQEIQLIGGLIIIAFGIKLFTSKPKLPSKTRRNGTTLAELRRIVDIVPERLRPALRFQIWRIVPHAGVIPQTFFLTITNPGAILSLFGIIGSMGTIIGGIHSYIEALTLGVSVMGGSLLWWAVLSQIIEKLRGRINEGRLKLINQVAGVALFVFGGLLFFKLALGVMGHAADTTLPALLTPVTRQPLPVLLGNPI